MSDTQMIVFTPRNPFFPPEQEITPDGMRAEYFLIPGQPLGGLPEGWCAYCASWQPRQVDGRHAGALVVHDCAGGATILPTRVRRLVPATN